MTKTIIRQVRRIDRAVAGHGYQATLYTEYSDGSMLVSVQDEIAIDKTRVRMKQKDRSFWEFTQPGMHGWFSCEHPYQLVLIS